VSGERSIGKVILVGAGPGAPDLITLRGERAIRTADAVVYDALAPAELLEAAPAGAERINVGKRGHDPPTRSQEEITKLLIELARAGKTVVRLKGGDPFVFGRGSEEATACFEAGIPFEVVPGVTSSIAALAHAGIPVTDRRYAASFAVVTGHRDPTRVREQIRWEGLAASADTLVVLMGMSNLEEIVGHLLAGGRAATTPAAVVMEGTTARQRVVVAPLSELVRRAREAGIGAPAAVVVGDVVRLRKPLAWFERLPLFGKRVLVTRTVEQSASMREALLDVGAEAVVIPMIRIEPVRGSPEVDAALARLPEYDLLLLTSANAARQLVARAAERGCALAGLRAEVVCVGPATAAAALELGLPIHRVPVSRFDAEGMLDEVLRELSPAGKRFLLPRAERSREVLPDGLREAGARVDTVAVYRTVPAEVAWEDLGERLAHSEFDALTFASPSAVRHFFGGLDTNAREAAERCVLAAIGPVTADALRAEGIEPDLVPERAEARALVEALVQHAARRGSDSEGRGGCR
jgi:uroporphyrinogen III methyltransferase/synthase